jgi:hypothetical protein
MNSHLPTLEKRYSLIWDVTQRRFLGRHWRFGTTYSSLLHGSRDCLDLKAWIPVYMTHIHINCTSARLWLYIRRSNVQTNRQTPLDYVFVWHTENITNREYNKYRQSKYKSNIEPRSRNHCCRAKAIPIIYSECLSVALVIQHALRISRVMLSSVVCPALPYFRTLSHKRHDLVGEKIIKPKIVFWCSKQVFV